MTDTAQLVEAFDSRVQRREQRREFFKAVVGAAAIGAGAFAFASAAEAQAVTDNDILNFALNLEYLEANFYYYAVFGTPIPATSITGVGTAVPTDSLSLNAGAHAVPFTDAVVAQYAREIAADELAHVNFLRSALTSAAVAQPQIDVGITPNGAFSSAARAAGIIGATSDTAPTFFDPYASDENFLLGAFIFEDVGVTAYKGASPLITSKAYLEAAAGILAVEAYHASIVRTVLYAKGIGTPATATTPAVVAQPALITNAGKISDARDSLDGTSDLDQGIATDNSAVGARSNIAPLDGNGLAFSRSTGQVLNIVYLNRAAVTLGGFFPQGVNGSIRTSANNVPAA
ncbi:ferritin-like domain-containing protein [Sphingomonas sp.]|uniref:ferritin-like domain-containing protein n=1 Tax=Sphingomonas sp. TaxID=28214 RepID=UPI003B00611A